MVLFFPFLKKRLITILNRERLGSDLDQNISWQPRSGGRQLVNFLLTLVEPFYTPASSLDPASVRFVAVPLLPLSHLFPDGFEDIGEQHLLTAKKP